MIEDPPLLTIRRAFERPPTDIIGSFEGVPTGHVVDAMSGRGALDHRIRPLFPDNAAILGVALTCHAGPADNLAVFGAVDAAQRGDVIVAAADGFVGTSVTGDLLLGMAKNKGAAGFVTDGLVRDVAGLEAVGLPIHCTGVTANSPARNGPGTVGSPIVVGGVTVHAGDLVIGDRDGVVVIARAEIDAVLSRLPAIKAAEHDLEAKVRAGLEVPDFIRAVLNSDRTQYLD